MASSEIWRCSLIARCRSSPRVGCRNPGTWRRRGRNQPELFPTQLHSGPPGASGILRSVGRSRWGSRCGGAAAAALALSGCWLQAGYNQYSSGHNPLESALNLGTAGDVQVLWTATDAVDGSGWAAPTIVSAAGLVHTVAEFEVIAFEPATGAVRWRTPIPGAPFENRATMAAGIDDLLVATFEASGGMLYRFDPDTGALEGSTPIGAPSEADSGMAITWMARSGDRVVTAATYSIDTERRDEAVLTITDLGDPTDTWTRRFRAVHSVFASNPVIVGNRVVVAISEYAVGASPTFSSRLEAYDLAVPCPWGACDPVAELALPGEIPWTISAAADGRSIAVNLDRHLAVIDVPSFSGRWTREISLPNSMFRATPTWSRSGIVVPRADVGGIVVHSFAPEGCVLPPCPGDWTSAPVSGYSLGSVASAGELLWLTTSHFLVALPAACDDGCEPVFADEEGRGPSPPVVTGGRVFAVGWYDLTVYGLPP